jgi:hypothetical protein
LYTSADIVRMMKSRRMGACSTNRFMPTAYEINVDEKIILKWILEK